MKKVVSRKLADSHAEIVRRSTTDAIEEIQLLPILGARVIADVELADNVPKVLAHRLGRTPQSAWPSAVRNEIAAGVIRLDAKDDKTITVTAGGYGATITVDFLVF